MMKTREMRKMLCIALTGVMCLLTGCGGAPAASVSDGGATSTSDAEQKVLRVGM